MPVRNLVLGCKVLLVHRYSTWKRRSPTCTHMYPQRRAQQLFNVGRRWVVIEKQAISRHALPTNVGDSKSLSFDWRAEMSTATLGNVRLCFELLWIPSSSLSCPASLSRHNGHGYCSSTNTRFDRAWRCVATLSIGNEGDDPRASLWVSAYPTCTTCGMQNDSGNCDHVPLKPAMYWDQRP